MFVHYSDVKYRLDVVYLVSYLLSKSVYYIYKSKVHVDCRLYNLLFSMRLNSTSLSG